MYAMILKELGAPLTLEEVPDPIPGPREILISVEACGVCRTDLHIVDGDLDPPPLPLILGHQIVGRIRALGPKATRYRIGERMGVPWLARTCHTCSHCILGEENLCDSARFTGYTSSGGFAELATCHEDYCFPLPESQDPLHLAPLLCAGLIGYRAYRKAAPEKTLGLYGFGASAHILAQLATAQGIKVYAFTRPGDTTTQKFALKLGATWAGGSDTLPPTPLDAAILFAPVGALVPESLKAVRKGGRVICAGIHMSDIPSFPYSLLWGERILASVANLTRDDGHAFFQAIENIPIQTQVTPFPLAHANEALAALRSGAIDGAIVLTKN